MARTPGADRSNTSKPDEERRESDSENRVGSPVDPTSREPGGQAQQRSPQDRDFAPGEDGECH